MNKTVLNKRPTHSPNFSYAITNQTFKHPITKTKWAANIQYSEKRRLAVLKEIQGDYTREMELFFAVRDLLAKEGDKVNEVRFKVSTYSLYGKDKKIHTVIITKDGVRYEGNKFHQLST